jgi:TatD DNase family protein
VDGRFVIHSIRAGSVVLAAPGALRDDSEAPMELVDTHIHLDLEQFADDLDDVIDASRAAGVSRWINVGFDERRWETTLTLTERFDGLYAMLGLHPGNADDWSPRLFARLDALVRARRPVAIGEIGIDLYWRQDNLETQMEALRAQLDLAVETGLPAVIHMRDADAQTLEVLTTQRELPHIHFHSFDGGADLRAWAIEHKATIGVGGLITRKGTDDLRDWLSTLDRDRVVMETDAPYLKPRGIRGTRNQPAYLVKSALLLTELWTTDLESVARITTANAERIFSL